MRWGTSGWLFLVLRAYGYWDFPKGRVEPGETAFEAAVRETREETTLTDLDFRWGDAWIETEPYASGKVARYYLAASGDGDVRLEPSPATGKPEHHEFRWVTYDEASTLLVPRLRRVLAWATGKMAQPPAGAPS